MNSDIVLGLVKKIQNELIYSLVRHTREIASIRSFSILLLMLFLASCSSVLINHDYVATDDVSKETHTSKTKGIVLVTTSGGRTWGCGSYENAELRSIGFDLEKSAKEKESIPDLVINSTPDGHMNYAFALEPGTYGISYISIKVARSMSDVGYINANRSALMEGPLSKGGSFTVIAGETVYIGHFALDCAYGPALWRFYLEDREGFEGYVDEYKAAYPYLDLNDVKYRLFTTQEFGHDFALP
jgi:hypothetical protein